MTTTTKPRGRPAGAVAVTSYRVSLDDVTVSLLRTIGEGNLSAGIRIVASRSNSAIGKPVKVR